MRPQFQPNMMEQQYSVENAAKRSTSSVSELYQYPCAVQGPLSWTPLLLQGGMKHKTHEFS